MKNLSKFFIVFLVLITVVSISSISAADCTSDIVSSDYEDTSLNDGESPVDDATALYTYHEESKAPKETYANSQGSEISLVDGESSFYSNYETVTEFGNGNSSKINEETTITAFVSFLDNSSYVKMGNVTLTITSPDGKVCYNATEDLVTMGVDFKWTPTKAGVYNLHVRYNGYQNETNKADPSEADQVYTVIDDSTPTTTTITSSSSSKVKEKTTIKVTVVDNQSEAVSVGNATLTISKDGKTVYTDTKTLSTKGLSFDWTPTAVGTYNFLVKYNGFNSDNVKYAPSQASQTYKVTGDSTYQLIVKNVNMYYADGTKLVVKVLNDAGKPVKNVAVHVKINGKTHKLLTNNKGLADLALNLNPKKYTVISTIPDTDVKTKSTYTVNKWKKSLTSFTVQSMAKAFKTAKPFRVLLKHNNVPAAGQTINVQVGQRTFKIKTNSKGIASLAVSAKPGIYPAKVSMNVAGVKLTKVANIIVTNWKKQYARLKVSKVEDVLQNGSTKVIGFKAHLSYDGENIAQQPIFFIINNKIYESITNNNGLAYCKLHQKSGTYIGYALTKVTTVTLITVLREKI